MARRPAGPIVRASANLFQWLPVTAEEVVGTDLGVVLGPALSEELCRLETERRLDRNPVLVATVNGVAGPVEVTAHANGEWLIVELEPGGEPESDRYASLRHSIRWLEGSFGVIEFSDRLAAEVRRLTGFDRVMVYRFNPDKSGEVIAEAVRPGLPTYLGLHYPAGDIPATSRAIYGRVWVRVIPDIRQPGVPLVPQSGDNSPADLTYCHLRGLSPIHVEYLTNMGVTATMSLSLRRGDELWGLVACHHYAPRRLAAGLRSACEVIAQVASLQLVAAEESDVRRYHEAARGAHDAIIARAADEHMPLSTLVEGNPGALDVVNAAGVALHVDDSWIRRGDTPPDEQLDAFARWLGEARSDPEVFATDALATEYPPAADWTSGAAGVLAARLTVDPVILIVWFRPEVARTVRWGGDPNTKPVAYGPHGPRLHPRQSFEVWLESVHGRSAPWTAGEVDEVRRLRTAVRDVIHSRHIRISRTTRLFRAVMDSTTDAIFVKDRSGTYLLFNEAAARLVGKPARDVIGKDDRAILGADSARAVMDNDRRIMASGESETVEEALTIGDISRIVSSQKVAYRDATGTVIGLIGVSRDVTDRKTAERQLRAEHDRFQKLMEAVPIAICAFRLGPDGSMCFPYASPKIEAIYGISPSDLARDARPVFDLIHPHDVGRVRDLILTSGRTLTLWRTEFRVVHPDQGERWVEGASAPIREPDGSTYWHGYVTDITERKRTADALRESEALYRATFEQAAVGVAHVALDGRFLRVNARFADITGYSEFDLRVRTFRDITHPDDLAADVGFAEQLVSGRLENYTIEKRYVRPDGSAVWANRTVSLRRTASGQPLHYIKVIEDITVRKRAEEDARQAREMLRLVLDTVPQGVFWKDSESRHLGCNRVIAAALGFESPDQVIGLADSDLPSVSPAQAEQYMRVDREVIESGTPRLRVSEQLTLADGGTRWLETNKLPLRDAAGRVIGVIGTWEDVTDRRRTALALQESEYRFRMVFEHAAIGIAITTTSGTYLQCNPTYAGLLGYTEQELQEIEFPTLIHPDDREENMALVRRLLAGEVADYQIENRFVHKSGADVWVRKFVSILPDETRKPAAFLALVTDVTQRRRSEEALRRSEERFRTLVAFLPDAVFIILNDRVAFCNPAGVQLFGASDPSHIVGKSPFELMHPHYHQVIRDRMAAIRPTGEGAGGREELAIRLDGTIVPVYVTALPIPDRDKSAILVVLHDLTEQKRLELRLRHQELLLREAAELAHVGGWTYDPATNVIDATGEVVQIIGGPPSRTGLFDGVDLFLPEDRPLLERALRAAVEHGTPYDLQLRLVSPAGEPKWVRTICRPIVEGGVVVRVRGAIQDITDRKRAEAEILQLNAELEQRVRDRTAELEAANRELESFSYSVSHDLRAPLRAINGFTQIVLDEFGPRIPEEARGYLNDVAAGGRRMGQLVDDLLAFSRLGRQPLRRQPVDVNAVVADCLREAVGPADRPRVELHVGHLPGCKADPGLLHQVWLNLLSNAVKYSGKRERAVIGVGAERGPDGPTYFVRDNGAGFDMRYAHKLFGVFQRLHRAEDFSGTGIGLALVQRIIHRHGGRVWAHGEPDKGAAFFFTIGEPTDPGHVRR